MPVQTEAEVQAIVDNVKSFLGKLADGQVDIEAFRSDAAAVVAGHGIQIPAERRDELNAAMRDWISTHGIQKQEDFTRLRDTMACAYCTAGLTIVFAAIVILTVLAAAAAIAAFTDGIAAAVAAAFLESAPAVRIVLGIIITGSGVLAEIVCTKLIKCSK